MRYDLSVSREEFLRIKKEGLILDPLNEKVQADDLIFFHDQDNEYDVLCGIVRSADPFECKIINDLYYVDGHTHLEHGPLSKEYVMSFVQKAVEAGLDEIDILDHSHRFKEFESCYDHLREYDVQDRWLDSPSKFCNTLDEYYDLIDQIRKEELPIRVKFGLEVCYSKITEKQLREILKDVKLDFLTGAIHSVFSILYDMPFSNELLWDVMNTDEIYREYYNQVSGLISSSLFDRLAHPDQIKLFNRYPSYDLKDTYRKIAKELNDHRMYAENNTGIYYRYHHLDKGINDEMFRIFSDSKVRMICASDSHDSETVGAYIKEATLRIKG